MGDEGQVLELLATDLDRYFYLNQPIGTIKTHVHRGMLLLRKTVMAQQSSKVRGTSHGKQPA